MPMWCKAADGDKSAHDENDRGRFGNGEFIRCGVTGNALAFGVTEDRDPGDDAASLDIDNQVGSPNRPSTNWPVIVNAASPKKPRGFVGGIVSGEWTNLSAAPQFGTSGRRATASPFLARVGLRALSEARRRRVATDGAARPPCKRPPVTGAVGRRDSCRSTRNRNRPNSIELLGIPRFNRLELVALIRDARHSRVANAERLAPPRVVCRGGAHFAYPNLDVVVAGRFGRPHDSVRRCVVPENGPLPHGSIELHEAILEISRAATGNGFDGEWLAGPRGLPLQIVDT
jgi:hypothetical protein